MTDCRLGLVALGDSITVGHGGMQSGLGSQSWAHWLAQALELPFTGLAVNGATAPDVLRGQVPRLGERRYDVGCVYVGVNDVRDGGWDPVAYERDLDAILTGLAARCDRTLTLTIPLDLGLPPAGQKVGAANAVIERLAGRHGAVVVDLRDFTGAAHVWADRVHATATGQVEIADRAAHALGAARLPSEIAEPPAPDLAYRFHYAKRTLRERVRAALARALGGRR